MPVVLSSEELKAYWADPYNQEKHRAAVAAKRRAVHAAIRANLVESAGLTEQQASRVIESIECGNIPYVSINA